MVVTTNEARFVYPSGAQEITPALVDLSLVCVAMKKLDINVSFCKSFHLRI